MTQPHGGEVYVSERRDKCRQNSTWRYIAINLTRSQSLARSLEGGGPLKARMCAKVCNNIYSGFRAESARRSFLYRKVVEMESEGDSERRT